jgi:hypothetical protein
MEKNKTDKVVDKDSKISVIEEALLNNIVGGAMDAGEISRMCCCECTGK